MHFIIWMPPFEYNSHYADVFLVVRSRFSNVDCITYDFMIHNLKNFVVFSVSMKRLHCKVIGSLTFSKLQDTKLQEVSSLPFNFSYLISYFTPLNVRFVTTGKQHLFIIYEMDCSLCYLFLREAPQIAGTFFIKNLNVAFLLLEIPRHRRSTREKYSAHVECS